MAGNLKENSRNSYVPRFGGVGSVDELSLGCFQRIADSLEKMAKSFEQSNARVTSLLIANDRLEKSVRRYKNKVKFLKMQNNNGVKSVKK